MSSTREGHTYPMTQQFYPLVYARQMITYTHQMTYTRMFIAILLIIPRNWETSQMFVSSILDKYIVLYSIYIMMYSTLIKRMNHQSTSTWMCGWLACFPQNELDIQCHPNHEFHRYTSKWKKLYTKDSVIQLI